jgi:hypothetical protein
MTVNSGAGVALTLLFPILGRISAQPLCGPWRSYMPALCSHTGARARGERRRHPARSSSTNSSLAAASASACGSALTSRVRALARSLLNRRASFYPASRSCAARTRSRASARFCSSARSISRLMRSFWGRLTKREILYAKRTTRPVPAVRLSR